MHVLLDVSRFLGCSRRRAPSGIDRVEAAYARRWLAEPAKLALWLARLIAEAHGGSLELGPGRAALTLPQR